MRRAPVPAILALLAPCLLVAQPTREFGAATYTPPGGWQLAESPALHRLSRVQAVPDKGETEPRPRNIAASQRRRCECNASRATGA